MKLTKNRVGILVKQYCQLEWPNGDTLIHYNDAMVEQVSVDTIHSPYIQVTIANYNFIHGDFHLERNVVVLLYSTSQIQVSS